MDGGVFLCPLFGVQINVSSSSASSVNTDLMNNDGDSSGMGEYEDDELE